MDAMASNAALGLEPAVGRGAAPDDPSGDRQLGGVGRRLGRFRILVGQARQPACPLRGECHGCGGALGGRVHGELGLGVACDGDRHTESGDRQGSRQVTARLVDVDDDDDAGVDLAGCGDGPSHCGELVSVHRRGQVDRVRRRRGRRDELGDGGAQRSRQLGHVEVPVGGDVSAEDQRPAGIADERNPRARRWRLAVEQ